jgi:hypothetical protein
MGTGCELLSGTFVYGISLDGGMETVVVRFAASNREAAVAARVMPLLRLIFVEYGRIVDSLGTRLGKIGSEAGLKSMEYGGIFCWT